MSSKSKKGKCTFKPGDRVQVISGDLANELGYVRFVGKVKGKDVMFVGMELDEARGKHDGEVKSVRYFKTAENHGYMAPYTKFQYFKENEISLNWNNTVKLITTYWYRTTQCSQNDIETDNNDNVIFLNDDGVALKWIIAYGELIRYQYVYGCGNNEFGELGLSKISEILKFTKLKVKDIERVYCSDGTFFMIRGDEQNNHILASGNNNWCQLGLGRGNHRTIMKFSKINKFKNILYVSGGLNATHTFFVMKNYDIYCCGNNTTSQLGIEHSGNIKEEHPVKLPLKKSPFFKDQILSIKCGLMHTIFLTKNGAVYGVGANEDGQIGLGKKNKSQEIKKITLVKELKETKCVAIECGMNSSFAVDENGAVYSWGKNTAAVLGLKKKMRDGHIVHKPTKIPYFIKNDIKICDIYCSAKHVLCVNDLRNVYCWGSNKLGQCGIGSVKPEFVEIPKKIKIKKGIKINSIRIGSYHVFIKTNGNEWLAFGSNAFRQCIIRGDEFDEKVPTPTLIDKTFLPKKCQKSKDFEIVCSRETTLVLFN